VEVPASRNYDALPQRPPDAHIAGSVQQGVFGLDPALSTDRRIIPGEQHCQVVRVEVVGCVGEGLIGG
jgi:hypothetical protein